MGQDEAVAAVANAIRRSRAGISDPNRPIGSFLFLGPTGVGKTELARALAEFLFDDEHAMVRIDMSEYQERHAVSRLVGAPPGYVGYEEGGQLTEAVRRRPYSVLLLDEMEKAHADVFNILLQLLDDGRLTDGQGRTVDFRNTIVIMTSNLGSTVFNDSSLTPEKRKAEVLEDVRGYFRPEFVNRVDEILVFDPLSRDQIARIVDIQLRSLRERLAERKLTLTLTDAAREYVANAGYDPAFGARPLKRVIQREIQDKLALALLLGRDPRRRRGRDRHRRGWARVEGGLMGQSGRRCEMEPRPSARSHVVDRAGRTHVAMDRRLRPHHGAVAQRARTLGRAGRSPASGWAVRAGSCWGHGGADAVGVLDHDPRTRRRRAMRRWARERGAPFRSDFVLPSSLSEVPSLEGLRLEGGVANLAVVRVADDEVMVFDRWRATPPATKMPSGGR